MRELIREFIRIVKGNSGLDLDRQKEVVLQMCQGLQPQDKIVGISYEPQEDPGDTPFILSCANDDGDRYGNMLLRARWLIVFIYYKDNDDHFIDMFLETSNKRITRKNMKLPSLD